MSDNSFDRISKSLAAKSSRRQALKLLGGGVAAGALAATGLTAATAQRAQEGTGLTVSGVLDNGTALTGTLNDLVASVSGGALVVSGAFSYLNAGTTVVQEFSGVLAELATDPESCEILYLDLGPILLTLLGLNINLSQIILNIEAVPGAGNLLGNLLCAVAGLLDRGGPLQGITNLLNQIFSILG